MSLNKIYIVVDVTPPRWLQGQKDWLADILYTCVTKFAVEEVRATRKELEVRIAVPTGDVGDVEAFRKRVIDTLEGAKR